MAYNIISEKLNGHYPIFDVVTREIEKPQGKDVMNVVLHRDAVNVLLIDRTSRQVIITKEYRAGVNDIRIATPAGLIEDNESPFDTAVREVFEETGATLYDIQIISEFVISSSEGFTSEELHIFILEANVSRSDERHFDKNEYVDSKWVDFTELVRLVDLGIVKSAPTVSAVRTLQLKLLQNKIDENTNE